MSCGSMESYTENFWQWQEPLSMALKMCLFFMEETDSTEMCVTKKIDGENL